MGTVTSAGGIPQRDSPLAAEAEAWLTLHFDPR